MASGQQHRKRISRANPKDRYLSVKEISERYNFHPNTVRAWANRDGLRHVRRGPGGKLYIREGHVRRFIRTWYEEV